MAARFDLRGTLEDQETLRGSPLPIYLHISLVLKLLPTYISKTAPSGTGTRFTRVQGEGAGDSGLLARQEPEPLFVSLGREVKLTHFTCHSVLHGTIYVQHLTDIPVSGH